MYELLLRFVQLPITNTTLLLCVLIFRSFLAVVINNELVLIDYILLHSLLLFEPKYDKNDRDSDYHGPYDWNYYDCDVEFFLFLRFGWDNTF